MKENFLLEIGTEELPPSFIKPALEFLRIEFDVRMRRERLTPEKVETFGTPRRLIIIAYGVPEVQPESEELIVGPSLSAAFDEEGNPTRAAVGFARSKGASVDELVKVENPPGKRGVYVAIRRRVSGKRAEEVISSLIPQLIRDIPFRKSMRWGTGRLRFARPIRWITAVFGGRTVEFEIDGIRSGNTSRGHRFLSPEPFTVREASDFLNELEKRFVIADISRREAIILDSLNSLSKRVGGKVLKDRELLSEVVNLVEYPVPLIGSFDREFLRLPKEVPVVVMRDHQRYFSIVDEDGKLKNHFIAVSNIKVSDEQKIIRGYEKVLRARLSDALFFYNEDRKGRLEERIEGLKGVILHEKLGTVYDKVQRLKKLSPFVARTLWEDSEIEGLSERAALLSKSDLLTEMVKEFPELQGTMGKYYALEEGEDRRVAEAIEEQYLPRFLGDRVARTETGISLSIAEKVDNLTGFIGAGLKPSGSEDPFALRRSAVGIIHTILRNEIDRGIREIIDRSFRLYTVKLSEDTPSQVEQFIKDRFRAILLQDGFDFDVVDSILPITDNLYDARKRVETLQSLKRQEGFEDVMLTFRRVMNIIPEGFTPFERVEPTNEYESELLRAFDRVKRDIELLEGERRYREAFLKVKELKPFVDRFFDNVLVMEKDERVRRMRLSLLKMISDALLRLADFSKIKPS